MNDQLKDELRTRVAYLEGKLLSACTKDLASIPVCDGYILDEADEAFLGNVLHRDGAGKIWGFCNLARAKTFIISAYLGDYEKQFAMMALGCKYIFDLPTSYELSTQTKTSLVLDIKASATHAESEAKYLDHIATCDASIPVIMFVENLTPELKA